METISPGTENLTSTTHFSLLAIVPQSYSSATRTRNLSDWSDNTERPISPEGNGAKLGNVWEVWCPEGAIRRSPGFQPRETGPNRTAL
jgi:hypothetical protein